MAPLSAPSSSLTMSFASRVGDRMHSYHHHDQHHAQSRGLGSSSGSSRVELPMSRHSLVVVAASGSGSGSSSAAVPAVCERRTTTRRGGRRNVRMAASQQQDDSTPVKTCEKEEDDAKNQAQERRGRGGEGNRWPVVPTVVQVAGEFQLGEKVSYSDHGLDEVYNEEESALFYTGPNGEPLMYTDVEPQVYSIKINNPETGETTSVSVRDDRYILFEAEKQGLELPFACRMGCCTGCAAKIVKGEVFQPEALGISQELRDGGYTLLCVAFPLSELEVELQDPDEVYWKQFGQYFGAEAGQPILRDDFALELADCDE